MAFGFPRTHYYGSFQTRLKSQLTFKAYFYSKILV